MRSSCKSDVPLYLLSISFALSSPLTDVNIHASAVEAMLAGDVLPESRANLIALHACQFILPSLSSIVEFTYTLAGLEMDLYIKAWSAFCSAL